MMHLKGLHVSTDTFQLTFKAYMSCILERQHPTCDKNIPN